MPGVRVNSPPGCHVPRGGRRQEKTQDQVCLESRATFFCLVLLARVPSSSHLLQSCTPGSCTLFSSHILLSYSPDSCTLFSSHLMCRTLLTHVPYFVAQFLVVLSWRVFGIPVLGFYDLLLVVRKKRKTRRAL